MRITNSFSSSAIAFLIIFPSVIVTASAYFFIGSMVASAITGLINAAAVSSAILIIKNRRFKSSSEKSASFVLWFTGLSGSGKTTLAKALKDLLTGKGLAVELLDGDEVRSLFPNTGFTREERNSHIMRVGHIASLLEKNGIIVLTSLISPYRESRDRVRKMCGNFIEVHVATSLEECMKRDVKGLYEKAGRGDIKNFTGLDDPYEIPLKPDITVNTENRTVPDAMQFVLSEINRITGLKL